MKCNSCGCQLTACIKRKKHIYYYCTNGKGNCSEHKNYLKEKDVVDLTSNLFKHLEFDEDMIDLCYEASLEDTKRDNGYQQTAENNINTQIKNLTTRQDSLLDSLLDKTITKEVYELKSTQIHNDLTNLKKQLKDLKSKNIDNRKFTLEQTKKLFLDSNNQRKLFLKSNPKKKKEILEKLLWNTTIENKKIAKFSFKQPYNLIATIPKNNDFLSLRRERDSNPH